MRTVEPTGACYNDKKFCVDNKKPPMQWALKLQSPVSHPVPSGNVYFEIAARTKAFLMLTVEFSKYLFEMKRFLLKTNRYCFKLIAMMLKNAIAHVLSYKRSYCTCVMRTILLGLFWYVSVLRTPSLA